MSDLCVSPAHLSTRESKLHSSTSLNETDRVGRCHLTFFLLRWLTQRAHLPFFCSHCCLLISFINPWHRFDSWSPPQPVLIMQVYGFVNTAVHYSLLQQKGMSVIKIVIKKRQSKRVILCIAKRMMACVGRKLTQDIIEVKVKKWRWRNQTFHISVYLGIDWKYTRYMYDWSTSSYLSILERIFLPPPSHWPHCHLSVSFIHNYFSFLSFVCEYDCSSWP